MRNSTAQLITLFIMLMGIIVLTSCQNHSEKETTKEIVTTNLHDVDSIQAEKDAIFMLLNLTLVLDDWQSIEVPRQERRGYNIGALLVSPDDKPVKFALNSINSTNNSTQHAEVRVISQFLEDEEDYNLKEYTLYTSLEPCVMCAGMVIMTNVKRVVYAQSDIDFSKAFERLALDSRSIKGYSPYPRIPDVHSFSDSLTEKLNNQYLKFRENEEEKMLARFLSTPEAKNIYQEAAERFLNFTVIHPENQVHYENAYTFYIKNESTPKSPIPPAPLEGEARN
jgi:tRNA(adenine34) deaminase